MANYVCCRTQNVGIDHRGAKSAGKPPLSISSSKSERHNVAEPAEDEMTCRSEVEQHHPLRRLTCRRVLCSESKSVLRNSLEQEGGRTICNWWK